MWDTRRRMIFTPEAPPMRVEPQSKSAHNESRSSVMHWPMTGARAHILTHRHKAKTPPMRQWRPSTSYLARGSKAVCRSSQSSQWATPLIQFCLISSEQTTRGVGTFLGSHSPGVILSVNDPRSGSDAVIACSETHLVLLAVLPVLSGGRHKDRHSSFCGHGGGSRAELMTLYIK